MASAERAFCSARRIEIPRWRRLQTSWKISATVGTDQRHDPAAVQREVDLLFAGGYIHPLYFRSRWKPISSTKRRAGAQKSLLAWEEAGNSSIAQVTSESRK